MNIICDLVITTQAVNSLCFAHGNNLFGAPEFRKPVTYTLVLTISPRLGRRNLRRMVVAKAVRGQKCDLLAHPGLKQYNKSSSGRTKHQQTQEPAIEEIHVFAALWPQLIIQKLPRPRPGLGIRIQFRAVIYSEIIDVNPVNSKLNRSGNHTARTSIGRFCRLVASEGEVGIGRTGHFEVAVNEAVIALALCAAGARPR